MRPPHVLSRNHARRMPTNFVFVDTETKGVSDGKVTNAIFRLGVACFTTRRSDRNTVADYWLDFNSPSEFWSVVDARTRDNTKTLIYAHNTHFDFFVLNGLDELKALGWEVQKYYVSSGKFIMPFKKGKKKLLILDSGNILKIPLADIGKFVGIPKMEVAFDSVNDEDLRVYCRNDVAIVRKWVLDFVDFVDKNDLGNFRYTLAGQCFNAYRHKFMKHPIIIHSNAKALELERKAYYGGRTEAFYIGKKSNEQFHILDVNSMYPYVMKENEYPTKLIYSGNSCSLEELNRALEKYLVIADVTLKTDVNAFPFRQTRVIFPTGTFDSSLCTSELKLAVKLGAIVKVNAINIYEKAPIFEGYIDYFYDMKLEATKNNNQISREIAKLFLNSLYGKFGQSHKDMKKVCEVKDHPNRIETQIDADTGKNHIVHFINGVMYKEGDKQEAYNSFPAIAAHVTSNARVKLWEYINLAGKENVFYSDTDSLLVNEKGKRNLETVVNNENLGSLSLECSADWFEVRGAKDYDFGKKHRIKGVKNLVVKAEDLPEFLKKYEGRQLPQHAVQIKENSFVQDQFLKFNALLRKGITSHVVIRKVTKVLTRKYEKGSVTSSGWVEPFVLRPERN